MCQLDGDTSAWHGSAAPCRRCRKDVSLCMARQDGTATLSWQDLVVSVVLQAVSSLAW